MLRTAGALVQPPPIGPRTNTTPRSRHRPLGNPPRPNTGTAVWQGRIQPVARDGPLPPSRTATHPTPDAAHPGQSSIPRGHDAPPLWLQEPPSGRIILKQDLPVLRRQRQFRLPLELTLHRARMGPYHSTHVPCRGQCAPRPCQPSTPGHSSPGSLPSSDTASAQPLWRENPRASVRTVQLFHRNHTAMQG